MALCYGSPSKQYRLWYQEWSGLHAETQLAKNQEAPRSYTHELVLDSGQRHGARAPNASSRVPSWGLGRWSPHALNTGDRLPSGARISPLLFPSR